MRDEPRNGNGNDDAGPFVERIIAWRRLWIEPETPQALTAREIAEKAEIPLATAYRWIAEWQAAGLIRPVTGGYEVGSLPGQACERIGKQWQHVADISRSRGERQEK